MPDTASGRSARWTALLDLLSERGRLSVAEACASLDVSEATIRRDFGQLAEKQLVSRVHGGVVATSVSYDLPTRYRHSVGDEAKARIAREAAALAAPGDVIGLNGGTTTTDVARQLAERPDLAHADRPSVTVVTNALNIASQLVLRPYLRCVSLGGVARPESYELTGPLAVSVMDQLWLDIAILGVAAFSTRTGGTCTHEEEASVGSLMAQRADRVVVVATGGKIGGSAFARMMDADAVDMLVTDDSAPTEELVSLRRSGVEVLLV